MTNEEIKFNYKSYKVKFVCKKGINSKHFLYIDDVLIKKKNPKFKAREVRKFTVPIDGNDVTFKFIPSNKEMWKYKIADTDEKRNSDDFKSGSNWFLLMIIPLLPLFLGGAVGGGLVGGGIVVIYGIGANENLKLRYKILYAIVYIIIAWIIYLAIAIILAKIFLW